MVCFRALRTPGSSLRDVLRGHRLGMDCHLADLLVVIVDGLPIRVVVLYQMRVFLYIIRQNKLAVQQLSMNNLSSLVILESLDPPFNWGVYFL